MGKKKKKAKAEVKDFSKFDYVTDLQMVEKLKCDKSMKVWIEYAMLENRLNKTFSEGKMEEYLKSKKVKFITQAPFFDQSTRKPYFADFYLPSRRIIIEVDGESHESERRRLKDVERDEFFKGIGVKTVRVSDKVVIKKTSLENFMSIYV